jgi:hypothetical protein
VLDPARLGGRRRGVAGAHRGWSPGAGGLEPGIGCAAVRRWIAAISSSQPVIGSCCPVAVADVALDRILGRVELELEAAWVGLWRHWGVLSRRPRARATGATLYATL